MRCPRRNNPSGRGHHPGSRYALSVEGTALFFSAAAAAPAAAVVAAVLSVAIEGANILRIDNVQGRYSVDGVLGYSRIGVCADGNVRTSDLSFTVRLNQVSCGIQTGLVPGPLCLFDTGDKQEHDHQ